MNNLKKQKSHAFGKDVYFLGKDKDGTCFWLEEATWDCDWYWGFGYVETYTITNRPDISRSISSHYHFKRFIGGKFTLTDHGLDTPLSEHEQWRLFDLMKSFYSLKDAAEVLGRGGSHISGTNSFLKQPEMVEKINKELLPKLFEEVYKLLEE